MKEDLQYLSSFSLKEDILTESTNLDLYFVYHPYIRCTFYALIVQNVRM